MAYQTCNCAVKEGKVDTGELAIATNKAYNCLKLKKETRRNMKDSTHSHQKQSAEIRSSVTLLTRNSNQQLYPHASFSPSDQTSGTDESFYTAPSHHSRQKV